ncbi:MAG: hypothetical protein PHY16_01470 [Methylobacter sp.]|nr:hypothetical protein [Methylobacter sp.]
MNITTKNQKTIDHINLRLSPDVFVLVDQARTTRLGNMSRNNTWIAEAIQEKLAREIEIGSASAKVAKGGS